MTTGRRQPVPVPRNLSLGHSDVLSLIGSIDWSLSALDLEQADDVALASSAIAQGAIACSGFGNIYAILAEPSVETVRYVNLVKGRPASQVGSVTTTGSEAPAVFDWSALPIYLDAGRVVELMDRLFDLGPFGFRGPAAAHLPAHLTSADAEGDGRSVQLIGPGYRCPINRLMAGALTQAGLGYLYVTSANRSHHATGSVDEPAHYRLKPLQEEFGGSKRFLFLAHPREAELAAAYPLHAQVSTTILSFHRPARSESGRATLTVERHGSLPIDVLAAILDEHGFAVTSGHQAQVRLSQRLYQST